MKRIPIYLKLFFATFVCFSPVYAQTGWQWAAGSVYSPVPNTGLSVTGAAIDDSGNIVVTGTANSSSGIGYVNYTVYGADTLRNTCYCNQHVVVKTDSNGHVLWASGSKNASTLPFGISTEREGNIYVFGRYDSSSISFDAYTLLNPGVSMYYLVKYSPAGHVLWARNVCGSHRHFLSGVMGIDGAGDVYVSGYFYSSTITLDGITLTNTTSGGGDTSDVFVAKFDKLGNVTWAKNFGGKSGEIPYAMTVAPTGNVYLTGFFSSDTMWVDGITLPDSVGITIAPGTPFFIKFDSAGHALWAKKYNAGLEIYALTTDAVENIYVTGALKGDLVLGSDSLHDAGIFNTWVAKYNPDGNVLWARCAGSTNIDQGWSIAVDNCDNVCVAGLTHCTQYGILGGCPMDFEGHSLSMPAGNWNPTFVAQYSTAGAYISSAAFASGTYHEYVLANNRGSYYLAGTYRQVPIDFGSYSLSAPVLGNQELFVAKNRYDSTGCFAVTLHTPEILVPYHCSLFPNPASNECTIGCNESFPANAMAYIYDLSGRLVHTLPLYGRATAFSLSDSAPGVYQCRVLTGTGGATMLKLVVMR